MNNLTTTDLSRIFGERIGQEIFINREKHKIRKVDIDFDDVTIGSQTVFVNDRRYDAVKLLLTPLEKISDEHLIQLFTIDATYPRDADFIVYRNSFGNPVVSFGDSRYSKWSIDLRYSSLIKLSYKRYEYLKFLGYDVPMFFGINHTDNGKCLIDLGVAIDRTLV